MLAQYHVAITRAALGDYLDPADLQTIITANVGQDRLLRLILYPEYHCDDSDFAAWIRYMALLAPVVETLQRLQAQDEG